MVQDGVPAGTPDAAREAFDYLSAANFDYLARFIEGHTGIKMPPSKKTMVECRLRRRVQALGLRSLADYCSFLFQPGGFDREAVNLIDAVTTNKTDFFREPKHFDFLVEVAIPALLAQGRLLRGPLKVWSAASSTGAEPYTLAMVLAEQRDLIPSFSILATDISTQVLRAGMQAIYPEAMAEPIPMELRKRYLLRGKHGVHDKVRVVPELRRTVHFQRLNLMEPPTAWIETCTSSSAETFSYISTSKISARSWAKSASTCCRADFYSWGTPKPSAGFELPLKQVATSVFRAEG